MGNVGECLHSRAYADLQGQGALMEWLIGKLLATPVIGAILQPIINGLLTAQKQKLDAVGSHEAKVAELAQRELAVQQREQELRAEVLVAEQGNWMTRWVRPLWALPFVLWTWKVVVYDLMLGWGSTPELRGITAQLCLLVAGAYFIGRSGEKIATILKR